jgi:RNA polymerase sigma factor (sigma-70 family)
MREFANPDGHTGPAPAGTEGPPPLPKTDLISQLFRDNNRALVNFLLTHLSDEQEAREVAQEAYVKLLQLDRPEAISFLRTYLFRIAANLAIDRVRRGARKDRIDRLDVFEDWSGSPIVEREVLAAQEVALVRQAISELKPNYQRAFILHKFRDWPVTDIAVDMAMTPRMVRSYIARSVCYCRLRLDGEHAKTALAMLKELMP